MIFVCFSLLVTEIPVAPPTTTASSTEEPAGKGMSDSSGYATGYVKDILL